MRTIPVALGAGLLIGLAACNNSVQGPAVARTIQPHDGFVHYSSGGRVQCDVRPVALEGTHTRVEANGGCRAVRVTGDHNDVIVEMEPGGVIEVPGAHNDIWWRPSRPGLPPVIRDTGASNSFHRDNG